MEKPLMFEAYPELSGNIPWIGMGTFPTPIQKMEMLGSMLGHNSLWVKRDDLSSDKMGGNKVRVMEFLLADAVRKGKRKAISPGALGSNQILASAIYGHDLGIEVVGIFFKQCDTDYMCKHMMIDKSLGVRFNHVENPYLVPFAILWHYLKNIDWMHMDPPFYVPTFGSSAICALGYFNAMLELKTQVIKGEVPEPDYIFVTAGTGGTMAGLELGARALGMKTKVVGVRITDWIACNEWLVASILNRAWRHLRKSGANLPALKWKASDINMVHDFFGGEYAKITDEAVEAKDLAAREEGLKLDTTYTAKTMAAMIDYIKREGLKGKDVLFWHTYNTRDLSPFIEDGLTSECFPPEFRGYFKEDNFAA